MKSEPQIKVVDLSHEKMYIVDFEELQKMQGTFKYKFITPYDEHTFLEIYGKGSRLVGEKEIAD